jgi:predicted nucleic acid-binding protein
MTVIVDANLLVALVSGDLRREQVLARFEFWIEQGESLHAPELASYEVANSLTRLVVAERFPLAELAAAWDYLLSLPITYHPLSQGDRVVEISLSLNRQNSYDAAYLALAETLQAELWTMDSPLYRNAKNQGFPIHLLGGESS